MNSRQRHTGTWTRILLGCGAVLWLAGCSTTKRLASDEVLYTGVKKITINTDSSGRIAPGIESAVKDPLSVKPNNPLYSPYARTPFPIGLWAYNHLYTPKTKGFRHWLYNRLAKNPVLISKVQPELRTKLVADILGNYGYFGSEAQYTLLPRKNPKKAKLSYDVHVGKPWFYDSIAYPRLTGPLGAAFDTLQASSLIRPGAQYNMDTLSAERQRISNILRNAGYYFFRPDYIDYQADTTQRPERVQLRMQVKPTVPEVALRPYTTGQPHRTTAKYPSRDSGYASVAGLPADLPEKTENPPESTLQSHHARQRQAVHGSRPEQNPDQPEQTGHIPLGKPQRHASRFAARTRYARCGNSRRFRLSAGGGTGNERHLEIEQPPRAGTLPAHKQQQSCSGAGKCSRSD